ncbi:hypothetical protein NXX53_06025 [Bacteroides salyersiae]|nr:hypothetical protein [Bacteroides salyersiae]
MQAVRLDTWEQTDRYVQYIYPYEKQDIGGARRKVLRNRHEQEERTLMDYQPEALNYSGISMEQARTAGRRPQAGRRKRYCLCPQKHPEQGASGKAYPHWAEHTVRHRLPATTHELHRTAKGI